MQTTKSHPKSLFPVSTHYCAGCGHGIAHRLIAEALDELGVQDRTIGVAPVGCAVLMYNYIDVDTIEAAHGRAPATATGLKRVRPDCIVFTYQGDGDLAAIGTAEIIHAANRGEHFTTIFLNNAIYGMTGGQMAPTTLVDQKTETTPYGRKPSNEGFPIKACEMLATLDAPYYIERVSVATPAKIRRAKKAIFKAFNYQVEERGFTFVEVISTCPTNWGMSPPDAMKWSVEHMEKVFPLGVFRDKGAEKDRTETGADK
ncbi:MAG: 2-oxoglutarate oxidoreductase [Planctomycetota bacterium]|nr:MAG: 2-oxoglutarate oxidoreductase [Planctomycetota bacterium]